MPFGFPIEIHGLEQNIALSRDGSVIATINAPMAKANSSTEQGKIWLGLNQVTMVVPDESKSTFNGFVTDLTLGNESSFRLEGTGNALAKTSIGNIRLDGIKFNVPANMKGMQGLAVIPPKITSLEVSGGSKEAMYIDIGCTINNPSDLKISVGDVAFNLLGEGNILGTVTMANLTLDRGENQVTGKVKFSPQGEAAIATGRQLLGRYAMGTDSPVGISGSQESTVIPSLQQAFSKIQLPSTMPGLKTQLLQSSRFTVLDNTGQTGMASAGIEANNPLGAQLQILELDSSISFHDHVVGTIKGKLPEVITIPAKSVQESPSLPLKLDLDPKSIVFLMEQAAIDSKTDLGDLLPLLDIVAPRINSKLRKRAIDVEGLIAKAVTGLKVDATLSAKIKVGDYETMLDYSQKGVPCKTST